MANQEKDNYSNHEAYDSKQLEAFREQQQDKLKRNLEKNVEAGRESVEEARQEALEQAASVEKEVKPDKVPSPAERRGPLTKHEKDISFDKTMNEVRHHLSGPSRTFSRIIHNKAVERISDTVGKTVARPNAILSGSVFAFLFTLAVYLIANRNGYALSGSETIASFALGWVVGLIVDYARILIGKRPN